LFYLLNDLQQDLAAMSRTAWLKYFADVPYFECSDPYLQTQYWYRWYGLRLLTVDLGEGQKGRRGEGEKTADASKIENRKSKINFPCIFEGIGGFRSHISY